MVERVAGMKLSPVKEFKEHVSWLKGQLKAAVSQLP